jgi:hypothetical protein
MYFDISNIPYIEIIHLIRNQMHQQGYGSLLFSVVALVVLSRLILFLVNLFKMFILY